MAKIALQELINLGTISTGITLTLLVLSYIAVSLRLWVRFRITKSPGWDDVAMIVTLILFTCYCVVLLVISFRIAQPKNYNREAFRVTLSFVQLSEVFYILTTSLLKVALGLFFIRVLTRPWQTLIFKIIIGVNAMYGFIFFFITLFQCGSPSGLSDRLLMSPKCLPLPFILTTGYLYGTINVVSDWTFVLIPISILVSSDLDRRSKISVGIIMAFGAFGSVSSILRMVFLKGTILGHGGVNTTSIKATIWTTSEPGTGIIASSIAVLRPLIRRLSQEVQNTVSKYGTSNFSRKGSVQIIEPNPRSDNTALTARSGRSADLNITLSTQSSVGPWSPATATGPENGQRITSVEMFNYKAGTRPLRV